MSVATATRHSGVRWTLTDTSVLIGRNLRHIARNPEQLVVATLLPVSILLVFRFMFGGAVQTGQVSYVNYLIAGVIVLSVSMNATSTTVGVHSDLSTGVVERLRSMPMRASSVLTGHVVAMLVRTVVSIVVMVAAGLLVGFRPAAGVLDWAGALGLLLLYACALAWIAALLGMLARSVDGATGYSMVLVFVPYLSSAFVPTETLPDGLREFVVHQPVTQVMDAVRALLLDGEPGSAAGLAVLWWAGILLLVVPLAGLVFRKRSAG